MAIKKNNLTSISKIKKEYPLFFDKVTMNNFNSIVYKDIKVLKDCTYFITSEYSFSSISLYSSSEIVYGLC